MTSIRIDILQKAGNIHRLQAKNLIMIFIFIILPYVAHCKERSVVWREFPELSSQEVTAFGKDASGCLWLGTTKGLGRFDGYSLRMFKCGRDNRISSLAIDKAQNIWFGTQQGAYILKPGSHAPTPVDSTRIQWKPVTSVYASADGSVWIAQRGYLRRYNQNGQWKRDYPLTDRSSNATTLSGFCATRNNDIYITTYSPVVYRYNSKSDKFVPAAYIDQDVAFGKIIEDYRENCLWIADHTSQIFRFDPEAKSQEKQFIGSRVTSPEMPSVQMSVHDMTQDITNGNIWVAGRVCMMLFAKTPDGHLTPTSHGLEPMLKGTVVETISSFNEGIWVSTYGYKTMLLPYNPANVHNTLFGWETSPREPLITAIQEDEYPGYYWIIQNRNGLLLYEAATGRVFNHTEMPETSKLRLHVATHITPSRKHKGVWVLQERSMTAHRLINKNGKISYEQTIKPGPQVSGETASTIAFEDHSGSLWIGSTDGAYRFNPSTGSMTGAAAPGCVITSIVQSDNDDIWFATRDNGLVQVTPEGKSIVHNVIPGKITAMTGAPDGWLWCVTDNSRITGYNHLTEKLTDITMSLPIESADVTDIAADIFGHIWIKTPATLIEFNPRNMAYRTHNVSNMSTPIEVFLSKFSFGHNGTLAIGGIGGAEVFIPSNSLDRQNTRINVAITEITTSDNSNLSLSRAIRHSDDTTFTFPATMRNISVNFSTLNYRHIAKVRYAYRMYPYEKEWNYTEEDVNTAFYNQIPHGRYEFQIRATDENGVMSDTFSAFTFDFRPAPYQTWWAYCSYALIAAIAIFLLIKFNLKMQRRKNERMWNDSSEMIKMRNYLQAPSPTQKPEFEELDKALFNKGVAIIESNLADPDFGVDSFARAMNMSRSTLSRKLKLIYGGTPLDLIRDIRMRHAKALLANPNLNVSEVAEAVGFPDRRYFSSSFKKATGMSPSDYQRQAHENSPHESQPENDAD